MPLSRLATSGIWTGFAPVVGRGELYKYRIMSASGQTLPDKADPYGVAQQCPPNTASIVWNLDYAWQDQRWMSERSERSAVAVPTARYGPQQDVMALIDALHANGIGVILDWVPSHFPADGHGVVYFDGTHLYEHGDPRQREHPEWGSVLFDYGRLEVQSFLTSS